MKKPLKAFDSKGETVRLTGVTTSTSKPGSEGKRAAWYVTPSSSSIFNSGGGRSSWRAETQKKRGTARLTRLGVARKEIVSWGGMVCRSGVGIINASVR